MTTNTPTATRSAAPATAAQTNYKRIGALIEGRKGELSRLLKNVMTPERMIRIALSDVARNPTLLSCVPESIANCLMVGAEFGLVVGGPLAEVYMIPRRNKHKNGAWCAEPMIGYRGYCRLAQRSPGIKRIDAHAVYEGEEFSYDIGTGEIVHRWRSGIDRSAARITEVYAIAESTSGARWVEVMDRAAVEKRRRQSGAGSSGPWVDWWDKMALKTVILSLLRGGRVPLSLEIADAITADADGDDEVVHQADMVELSLPDAPPADDAPPPQQEAQPAAQPAAEAAAPKGRKPAATGSASDIQRLVASYAELGVTVQQLEHMLQHPIGETSGTEFDQLRALYQRIKAGTVKVETAFPPPRDDMPKGEEIPMDPPQRRDDGS